MRATTKLEKIFLNFHLYEVIACAVSAEKYILQRVLKMVTISELNKPVRTNESLDVKSLTSCSHLLGRTLNILAGLSS